jgi:hypothetical protein
MQSLGFAIGTIALLLILCGVLYTLQKRRTYYIPEGFTNENDPYPVSDLNDIKNPISKVMKKIGDLSVYFANPAIWIDVIKHSNMSLTDLARAQIEKDRAAAATK